MVTLTRNDDTFRWEDIESDSFERIRMVRGVTMPVSSNSVNCAIHRAAARPTPNKRATAVMNGPHRRRIKKVR